MNVPRPGRITSTTPNEFFNELFPLLAMTLLARELCHVLRRYHGDLKQAKQGTASREECQEYERINERVARTMSFLERVQGCVLRAASKFDYLGDVYAKDRESVRRKHIGGTESDDQAFDRFVGPIEDSMSRMHAHFLEVMRQKMAEDRFADVDEVNRLLVECLEGGS